MRSIYEPATILGEKINVTGSTLFSALHTPVIADFLVGAVLMLIAVLALTAALSKKKSRRAAAYRVLKLILQTIRRSRPS